MDEGKPHIDTMNEEEARRIARLITGFIQGSLSEKEWDDLDDWIAASDKNMQLFEQLTDEDHLTESVERLRQIVNRAAMQKAGDRKTEQAPVQRSRRKALMYGGGYYADRLGNGILQVCRITRRKKHSCPGMAR